MAYKTRKVRYNSSASEELAADGYDFPIFENYHLIKIGASTVNQLQEAQIMPQRNYGDLLANKPDGLIIKGKSNVQVLIEIKKPGTLKSLKAAKGVITGWYYDLANVLNCNIICASDGKTTCWVHAPSKNFFTEGGNPIQKTLDLSKLTDFSKIGTHRELVELIEKLMSSNRYGEIINEYKVLNPQKLADKVWQKIWINTGRNPESCLYNVVEIFIFKFLSDLKVLPSHMSFETVYEILCKKNDGSAEEGLRYYANNVRKKISTEMFPSGDDGTTILNGTIFVNENGEPNIPQSSLFKEVMTDFYKYGQEEGAFINIDKNFKTRLYESFLRKEAGVSTLGQYFTPRNVVRAMIDMCSVIPDNAKICDPFCGVGGFLLEILNSRESLKAQYKPNNEDRITPTCEIMGFDKGTDERDDARTIILAKANMLIYLSDIITQYPNLTKEFSKSFNKTFSLLRSNVGTFAKEEYKDYFDFIFTNPPYVVKGAATIKDQIKSLGLKEKIYASNGFGLEGLALDWIVYSLKPGGKAFVVFPTGIFRRIPDSNLRKNILDKCIIDGVVSLPSKTFYATTQKTYILAITKKFSEEESQTDPIFAYIARTIGETLDSDRFPIEENDLVEMAKQFKYFCSDKKAYEIDDKKIKTLPYTDFCSNWVIEDHWSEEELIELGVKSPAEKVDEEDFKEKVKLFSEYIKEQSDSFAPLNFSGKIVVIKFNEILTWEKGNGKLTKEYMRSHTGPYPVYTADTLGTKTSGIDIDTYMWEGECIGLTTNGQYAGTFSFIPDGKYSMNGDAGRICIKEEYRDCIDLRYILYTLQDIRRKNGFEWVKKPKESDVYALRIPIPIKENGVFDINKQQLIAKQYNCIEELKTSLKKHLDDLLYVMVQLLPEEECG